MVWLPKKTVVVPVDFSEESLGAVDTGLEMVVDSGDLHLIHVLPTLELAEPGVIWATVDDEGRRHHALQALSERFTGPRYAGCRGVIKFGDPGHEIARYASEVAADLIVLPSHGRTGISRMLIGSVAERVVRLGPLPGAGLAVVNNFALAHQPEAQARQAIWHGLKLAG